VFETAVTADNNNKISAIFLLLVEPLLNRGHTLWMDNFYNARAIAQKLKSLKTDCVDTLYLKNKRHAKSGEG
jgi:hypothetical protein